MLTSSLDEGSIPSARYHHAASLLTSYEPSSGSHEGGYSLMLVVGGVTRKGVAMDTWSLNLSSLVWREHKVRILILMEIQDIKKSSCTSMKCHFYSSFAELSAAPSGRSHFNCTSILLSAADWGVLSRKRLQSQPTGVQLPNWELDNCPPHWHTTYRFLQAFS